MLIINSKTLLGNRISEYKQIKVFFYVYKYSQTSLAGPKNKLVYNQPKRRIFSAQKDQVFYCKNIDSIPTDHVLQFKQLR